MADWTGQQFGNYRLLRLLGRGGFAEVYLGQHVRLASQQAAIKILAARLSHEDIRDFEREAETIAALVHPQIVRLLDFDVTAEGIPFLVMDYAPNGSLRQRHRAGGQVPLPTVLGYVRQVAEGLQYAHDQKIIHRDIKPDNMLIGRRGEIVLSDFGIATIAHSTTSQSAQAVTGTIPYMAPEQIQEYPRPASDQYALGITVYEWLVGERPFQGSFTEIAVKHAMTPPPPLRTRRTDLPPALEQVVLTALAKDPKERFGSVQAFATALQAAAGATSSLVQATLPPASLPRSSFPATFSDRPPVSQERIYQPPAEAIVSQPVSPVTSPGASLRSPVTLPPAGKVPSLSQKSPVPVPAPSQQKPAGRRISRRAVLVGGIGTASVVIGGGGVVAWNVYHSLGTLLYTYSGYFEDVRAMAWSPDSKRIASASDDKTVQVWDASSGGNVYTYRGHSNAVHAVAWSPDGKRIASASDDMTVQVWVSGL